MGREIRRVPAGWEHPKNDRGHYKPLYDHTYAEAVVEQLRELPWYIKHPQYLLEFFECWPDPKYYRPRFNKPSHYQIYETVTEGTPVSPVFETQEEIKLWLLDAGFSERAATNFINGEWAPSFVRNQTTGVSKVGIQSLDWED